MKKDIKGIQKILNWIIGFLVIVLLLFLGYYFYNREVGTKVYFGEKSTTPIPLDNSFEFKTVDNRVLELKTNRKKMIVKGLEKKIIFLKVFGWDCQYCKKEIPQLIHLKKDLGSSFEVIAIEAEKHTNEESLEYIKKYGINYDIVNGNNQKRFYDYLKSNYGWSGLIPLTIVLGKGGDILAYEVGVKSYNLSELMKNALLRENSKK